MHPVVIIIEGGLINRSRFALSRFCTQVKKSDPLGLTPAGEFGFTALGGLLPPSLGPE